jgi:enoyl-CoA hydratase/carnithine racemase
MTGTGHPPEGDWLGTPYLRFERQGSLALVTVDRPEARNAMTAAMYFGLRYAVDRVNRDDGLAGLLVTGAGDVFVPGGDLGEGATDDWGIGALLGMDVVPYEAIRTSRKPVVCAVNGIAQGGGLMIAMLADVTVASERATFRAPEVFRGIADTGYAQVLPWQIGPARARDMLLTGRTVSAADAVAWGLVARVAPHDELLPAAREALEWCARGAPSARAEIKRVLEGQYGRPDRMTMDASLAADEVREGFQAFLERRDPAWVPDDLRTGGRL